MRAKFYGFAGLFLLAAGWAAAATPSDLDDLIGMRGRSLDFEMGNRGYTLSRAQGAQYWWNPRSGVCAAVSISNGRVSRITAVAGRQCGQQTAAPSGGSAGSIRGIAGMDSIEAIDVMAARGFSDVDSFSSGNTQYGIFYRRASRLCVQLTMANGRVLDARDIRTHPKCR